MKSPQKNVLRDSTIIVAVSGGIDSMSLLHVLVNLRKYNIVVAHYNHGIRSESEDDARFVSNMAKNYGLNFELGHADLGAEASEELARKHRYEFLSEMVIKYHAATLVTAHHYDDELETAVINILRGTGRKGLTPMRHNKIIWRPLLNHTRADIEAYAKKNGVIWREDISNSDERYLRNYIRRKIIPKLNLDMVSKDSLKGILDKIEFQNEYINKHVSELLDQITSVKGMDKKAYISLPHAVSSEIMIAWLRKNTQLELDRKNIERLTVKAKTAKPGSKHVVSKGVYVHITNTHLMLK